MIKLGILECDTLYDDLKEDYSSYGRMFVDLFERLGYLFDYHFFQVQSEHLPQAFECDAYLITGSKAGVYDQHPWLDSLANWVKAAHQRQEKIAGVCFGHQFLAHHLGGQAGLSEKGWGIGLHTTTLEQLPSWLTQAPDDQLTLIYSHQDQVQRLPAEAKRLAGSEFCPNAAFYIDNNVLTFQGHPEFTPEYLKRLLPRRAQRIGEALLEAKLTALKPAKDSDLVGDWLAQFFMQ